jgi:hypothetical protein
MRRKSRLFQLEGFPLAVVCTLAVSIVFFAPSCAETGRSLSKDSDATLLANFAEHEAEFNRLVEFAHQDAHMARITYNLLQTETATDWPRPEANWGITPDRWQAYNDLFTELKLSDGLIQNYPSMVWLVVSGQGMAAGGLGKGYAYLAEPPKTTQPSLDAFVFKDADSHFAYRPIKDNWYLFVAKY